VVAPERAAALTGLLAEAGETVIAMGRVGAGQGVRYTGRLL
jgi:phosphoribosylformylglycinamidine cyclo-ligase